MKNCIFCKIVNKEIPSYKIYENEYIYAFLDIANDCIGHTLVVPKKHFENVMDCDDVYYAEVTKAVKLIAKHYVKDCGFNGVNIMNASGAAAEQSVFHLHFHILPRKINDGMKTWPNPTKKNVDYEEIVKKLQIN